MTAIKKKAIELIMNLPDAEIRAILEKYELTKPDSTAKIDESVLSGESTAVFPHDYNNEREFLEGQVNQPQYSLTTTTTKGSSLRHWRNKHDTPGL